MTALARRLGPFDATMIVMGGIIGSGIFINPYVVARQVHSVAAILAAWALGGVIALFGAFVYAELAALRPEAGGQYAYLRDAYHPSVAFLYGWALLLVVQSGGMAAVAATFARYFTVLSGSAIPDWLIATVTLLILTIINCLGVRSGSTTQNALMLLKLVAIVMLIVVGIASRRTTGVADAPAVNSLFGFAAALTPVMFAYGGWQTATFLSAEIKRSRDLVVGLLLGVAGVATVYLLVNVACLNVLGVAGLAATTTPASTVMQTVMGDRGATLIAIGIAVSTLGFLSQGMLTAPRVYYAMARDGVFFRRLAGVHPKTQAPVLAIALQGVIATIIAVSGTYEQILSYVVSVDFIFFGLVGLALFIFRRRGGASEFRAPGHPFTTGFFTIACWIVVVTTVARAPRDSAIGLAILAAGLPAYLLLKRRQNFTHD